MAREGECFYRGKEVRTTIATKQPRLFIVWVLPRKEKWSFSYSGWALLWSRIWELFLLQEAFNKAPPSKSTVQNKAEFTLLSCWIHFINPAPLESRVTRTVALNCISVVWQWVSWKRNTIEFINIFKTVNI